jgi:hypothetical protein
MNRFPFGAGQLCLRLPVWLWLFVRPVSSRRSVERQLRFFGQRELSPGGAGSTTPSTGDGVNTIRRERAHLAVPWSPTYDLDRLGSIALVDHLGPKLP